MTEELNIDEIIAPTPPIRPARRAERQLRRFGGAELVSYQDQTCLLGAILDVCGYVFDETPDNVAALSTELKWYDPSKVVDGIRMLSRQGHISRVKRGGGKAKRWQVGNGGF